MLAWWLIGNCVLSVICFWVCEWSNHYLLEYLGQDEDGKNLYMHHTLTIPAKIVAVVLTVITMYVTIYSWGWWLLTLVSSL